MIKVRFYKLNKGKHKMEAEFIIYDNDKNKYDYVTRRIKFGARGYSDYTIHKDPARKERYLKRHAPNENWNDFLSPGALSRWILWNKPTLSASISDYIRRFGLKRIYR